MEQRTIYLYALDGLTSQIRFGLDQARRAIRQHDYQSFESILEALQGQGKDLHTLQQMLDDLNGIRL